MVFDLSAAPAVIGPKTQEAHLQLRRLAAGFADTAAMFETEPPAREWLLARFL